MPSSKPGNAQTITKRAGEFIPRAFSFGTIRTPDHNSRPMETALPIDQHTRFAATAAALSALHLGANPKLLDVGGFPGTFARFLQQRNFPGNVLTADVTSAEFENYRTITPGPLPFADAEFEVVLTNDTLEHVPPQSRGEFLRELQRCASRAVIIAAPFHHDDTARVEVLLNELHRELFGAPHPWLVEHRDYGLPIAGELPETFREGWSITHVQQNAPLREWLLWQSAHLAHQLRAEFTGATDILEEALRGRPQPLECLLPYRLVVTLQRSDSGAVAALEALASHATTPSAEGELCVAMAGFIATLLRAARTGGGEDRAAMLRVAVEDRIAAALRHQEGSDKPATGWRRFIGGQK